MLTDDERLRARASPWGDLGRAPDELAAILAEALLDEEIAIGAAWAATFGPIPTDEQFAAIIRTVRRAQARRAAQG
jgi:hypothetical protein